MKVEDVKKELGKLAGKLGAIKEKRARQIGRNNDIIASIEAENRDHHAEITEAHALHQLLAPSA